MNDIPQRKRKGPTVTRACIYGLNFDEKKSNHAVTSVLKQQKLLQNIAKALESPEETTKLIDQLNQFRKILTDPKNIRIQVVANVLELIEPKKPWINSFLPSSYANKVICFYFSG